MKVKSLIFSIFILILVLPLVMTGNATLSVSAANQGKGETPLELMVVRAYYETVDDIGLLTSFDLLEYHNIEEKYVLVATDQSGINKLEELGFRVVIDDERTADLNMLNSSPDYSIQSIPSYSCYRTVEETYATAQAIANTHPSLASWTDVGDSWEKSVGQADGYDMMVLKLTNKEIEGNKPKLFVTAAIHAREYATAEIATRFAEYLVDNYDIDADITWMLDYHEVHIMFHANPDGRKEAETGSSWRKNTNENYCGVTSINRGADLNRNFSYMWGTGGSSAYPCDTTYRGPSAGSEPETQAIQNYIRSIFPDQRETGAAPADATGIYIDLHSWGGYVMWPWGYTTAIPPNNTQMQTLGRKIAYFNNYKPGQITKVLYVASGGGVDVSYGELGVASYAIEVGSYFFEPCTSFLRTVLPVNLQALFYAAKVVRTPYMTPSGPDALNLSLSDSEVNQSETPTLSARIDDTRYNGINGTEPVQAITQAEYYIDIPPWVSGATAIPLLAADGSYNTSVENVNGVINTSGWSNGRHLLFVRGRDSNGNWGPVSAIFLQVSAPTAADLLSFNATLERKNVVVTWETLNEIDNIGFNLYRSETVDGERIKLNSDIIPTMVPPGSLEGAFYTYLDTLANVKSKESYYWLEDIDIFGNTKIHGPAIASWKFPEKLKKW